ncbi:13961_t:CDS:2 [Rhizophagus irregularis]|nr:13961_t:CDS:2 [Rhizophagus irregularis]
MLMVKSTFSRSCFEKDEINYFKNKPRVVNIDKPTENWVHQFENFCEKAGFTGKSIDITYRKELESQTCSFITVMKTNSAEQGKANVQGVVEECKKILYSPALNIDIPTGLLKKSFLNALFLALRGGEHYSLQYSHFKFRANGQGFDVNIPQSKTNQRGNADKEFYLREYVAEDECGIDIGNRNISNHGA